jgi:hypothetical protein
MTQPGCGPFDADGRRVPSPLHGPPPERQRKNRLPWLIVGGAVLISGLGILLVLLLRPDHTTGSATAATGSTAASSTPATASASGHGRLPGGAQVADRDPGGRARFDGSDEALGRSFFQKTLSGQGFREGSFDSVIHNQDVDSDIASFTLQLGNGEEFLLLVYVQGDGTVCDFI